MQPTVAQQESGTTGARVCSILALVFGAVAVLFFPIIFGPAAIILGIIGAAKGDKLGIWGIVAGVVGMIAGIALGAIVWNAQN